jgi:hypothetical protein
VDQYERTWFEVVVMDGVFMGTLELSHGVEVAVKDVSMDSSKVCFAFLELVCADG